MMIQETSAKLLHRRHEIAFADVVAIVAAILSLLSLTVLVPAGLHLPW